MGDKKTQYTGRYTIKYDVIRDLVEVHKNLNISD